MDLATIIGILGALGAILGGQALEGGHIQSILQGTAALIVFGGTFGAVAVQFSGATLLKTAKALGTVFKPPTHDSEQVVKTLVELANKARREGLVAIEKETSALEDEFMRRALELAVDGTEAKELRTTLELEIGRVEEENEEPAKVFEAAGGFAPTVGILGAVLGLIHVMENLADPSKLGAGIAVAFVATVYGVGSANLLFLPISGKLKMRLRERILMMELVTEGTCAIAESKNPRLIERQLSAFLHQHKAAGAAEAPAAQAAAAAAKG